MGSLKKWQLEQLEEERRIAALDRRVQRLEEAERSKVPVVVREPVARGEARDRVMARVVQVRSARRARRPLLQGLHFCCPDSLLLTHTRTVCTRTVTRTYSPAPTHPHLLALSHTLPPAPCLPRAHPLPLPPLPLPPVIYPHSRPQGLHFTVPYPPSLPPLPLPYPRASSSRSSKVSSPPSSAHGRAKPPRRARRLRASAASSAD